jgi:hypothetical protein
MKGKRGLGLRRVSPSVIMTSVLVIISGSITKISFKNFIAAVWRQVF